MDDLLIGSKLLGCAVTDLAYAHFRADGSFVVKTLAGVKSTFSAREVEAVKAGERAKQSNWIDPLIEERDEMRSTERNRVQPVRGRGVTVTPKRGK